jgi:hypothetical protein
MAAFRRTFTQTQKIVLAAINLVASEKRFLKVLYVGFVKPYTVSQTNKHCSKQDFVLHKHKYHLGQVTCTSGT